MPEFVNPKYANEEKTIFKSPTRLECMMQDYPKMVMDDSKIGFTTYDVWFCYSPAKNNMDDAMKCIMKGIPSSGAAEAEFNFYNWTRKMLEIAEFSFEESDQAIELNSSVQFPYWPRIFLDPNFAITYQELKKNYELVNQMVVETEKPLTNATTLLLMTAVQCIPRPYFESIERFEQSVLVFKDD